MSYPSERKFSLVHCLCGATALMVTLSIVFGLDALSDRYSAATMATAPAPTVVVAQR